MRALELLLLGAGVGFALGVFVGRRRSHSSAERAPPSLPPDPDIRAPTQVDVEAMWQRIQPALAVIDATRRN